jgi:hypothetical protein
LLTAAPRIRGGGVERPVRTGGGGGRLRGRGTAALIVSLVSGAGLATDGRGGALTVGTGARPGSVPSVVAPGGTAGCSDGASGPA